MEWIKIKVSHVLYEHTDFSDYEFMGLIRIMALTATMEHEPNDKEIRKYVHHNTLHSLRRKLQEGSDNGRRTLQDIIKKVLEDVEYTRHLKLKNRSRIAEYRHKKAECNELQLPVTLPVTLQDKIREDKIREEKITTPPSFSFDDFWNLYPKKVGMSMALLTFRATVKTEKDFEDLKTALKNYMVSEEYKKGYIKNGDNWIEDWRGWVRMVPKSQVKRQPDPIPTKPKDVFKGGAKEDIQKALKI